MPCVTQSCQQGRKVCQSPLICDAGLHRIDGPFHDYEADEPIVSSDQVGGWLLWLIVVAGVAVILAAVGLPLYFGVTP